MIPRTLPWLCPLLFVAAAAAAQDDHPNQPTGAETLTASGLSGRIEVGGDRDVFRLDAASGVTFRVETYSLSGGCDTVIHLYDPRGSQITSDDDGGAGYASRIEFAATEDAAYWLVVRHYDRNQGTGGYRVRVTHTGAPTSTTPTTPTTPTTATTATAPTAPAPSGGSGGLSSGRVFDPKLAGARLEIASRLSSAGAVRLEVLDAAGRAVVVLASANRAAGSHRDTWDGRDSQGRFVAPGAYRLSMTRGSSLLATSEVQVVRVGILSLAFTGSGRVPLTYHRADSWGSRFPVDRAGDAWNLPRSGLSAECLDESNGTALSTPTPHAGINGPPRAADGSILARGRSLPVAYALRSRAQARLTFGARSATAGVEGGCAYPLAGYPLRVVVEGGLSAQAGTGELTPGGTTTLDLPALPATLGKHRLRYRFRFYYRVGSTWTPLAGAINTEHVGYMLVAQPGQDLLPGGRPWVAALEHADAWVSGQSTSTGVLAQVVRGVNATQGLRYDVNAGAPAYTDANELHRPTLDLEAYLDGHANGRVVNCLDCSSLVNKLAAQYGARTRILILGWNFDLHYLRGIGWSSFTHSLFGGNHAFSYHAVATRDDGATVHDACLRVDGDARPDRAPHTEGVVTGMPFGDYRRQLSPDAFRIQDLGQASLR